jgi:hypothetical protein
MPKRIAQCGRPAHRPRSAGPIGSACALDPSAGVLGARAGAAA